MKRPLIGITVDTSDNAKYYESPFGYSRAVEQAGGLPILFPYKMPLAHIPSYVDLIDGVLFSGGNDLDPSAWGEERNPKTKAIDPDRETFERALMAEVEKRRTPTLGICLGSQLMNVYRGGSLQQFIGDVARTPMLEHRMLEKTENRHPVKIDPDSTLFNLLKKSEVLANSSHKQAMARIGRGLRIIATAPDGVVEAIEDPTMPLWLAVQWHPERLPGEADHEALFKLLVEKATKR
jgi:putative glutamine amidotransferase